MKALSFFQAGIVLSILVGAVFAKNWLAAILCVGWLVSIYTIIRTKP